MGFELKEGHGAVLNSELDSQTYKALAAEYGKEFADDMARQAKGEFTYLVVKKRSGQFQSDVKDEDFIVQREVVSNQMLLIGICGKVPKI
jgi:hypothetical protein